MTFTEKQRNDIEKLSAINYSVKQVAIYLNLDAALLQHEYEDEESEFHYHYTRGMLVAKAEIDMATLESAKKGNISAMQRYDKQVSQNKIDQIKREIFGID